MSNLMVFEGNNVEIIEVEGEVLFELYSTGMALGYVNKRKNSSGKEYISPYKSRIDKIVESAEITCVCQGVTQYLKEEDLYDFILEARTDKCKKFRKWVTNDVLPSVRKTGGYVSNDNLFIETYLPFADDSTKILFKTTLETVRKQNELIIKQSEEIKEKEKIIDNVINDKGLFAVGDVGKVLKSYSSKMGSKKIFEYMRDKSILINAKDTNRHNLPYDAYASHFNIKYVDIDKGYYTRTETKVYFTGKGLKWFLKKLVKEGDLDKNKIEEIHNQFK